MANKWELDWVDYNGLKFVELEKLFKPDNPYIFNFVTTNRGIGKTLNAFKNALVLGLNGRTSMQIARRKNSFKTEDGNRPLDNIFDGPLDCYPELFKDVNVYQKGGKFYLEHHGAHYWFCRQQDITSFGKNKSENDPTCDAIIFDEFIPLDGRYLGGPGYEIEMLKAGHRTKARGIKGEMDRKGVHIILCANLTDLNCPYFNALGIQKMIREQNIVRHKNTIAYKIWSEDSAKISSEVYGDDVDFERKIYENDMTVYGAGIKKRNCSQRDKIATLKCYDSFVSVYEYYDNYLSYVHFKKEAEDRTFVRTFDMYVEEGARYSGYPAVPRDLFSQLKAFKAAAAVTFEDVDSKLLIDPILIAKFG